MTNIINSFPLAEIDYISIAHNETLEELQTINDNVLISLAVFVDGIRLIDNLIVEDNN